MTCLSRKKPAWLFLQRHQFDMKSYSVPIHLQADGSTDCGPVSSTMILDFFGITSDKEKIISEVPTCEPSGTTAFDNANVLRKYGLDVEMVLAQPLLFEGSFIRSNPSVASIKKQIADRLAAEDSLGKKQIIKSLVSYLEGGGKLTLAKPTESVIRQALDGGKLVWVSMHCAVLGENEGGYHTVVVGGYREDEFLVFNPWPRSKKQSWEKAEDVVFGIYAATLFDYDNGTILLVGKS